MKYLGTPFHILAVIVFGWGIYKLATTPDTDSPNDLEELFAYALLAISLFFIIADFLAQVLISPGKQSLYFIETFISVLVIALVLSL